MSESDRPVPAWQRVTEGERRIGVALAVIALLALQLVVPREYAFKPQWIIPALEGALLVLLVIANPFRINRESSLLRMLGLALVSVASFATAWSVVLLSYDMITGHGNNNAAPQLIRNGAAIWLTNIIVFALWYWEFDRGGPAARANNRQSYPDLLFPQMATPHVSKPDWEPEFTDYFYVSFTNAAAFSPTDTMPLSRWAKLAMMLQEGTSLVTVALVIARAINILG